MGVVPIWRLYKTMSVGKKLVFLGGVIAALWLLSVVNMAILELIIGPTKRSDVIERDIVKLSAKYVDALARENANMVDGPYAARFTAYDLKRTMAVLLQNVLMRMERLEKKMDIVMNITSANNITLNVTGTSVMEDIKDLQDDIHLTAEDVIRGTIENCTLTENEKKIFPHCSAKMEWMKSMWRSHPCYAEYGVDGSDCSFIMYLSEVEGFCPKTAWKGKKSYKNETALKQQNYAVPRSDLDGLMSLLTDPNSRHGYAWMRMRISRMWDKWVSALKNLREKHDLQNRPRLRIMVHLGLLTRQSGWKFAETQFKGGPLGELVQWSDLIASLYLLGHSLTLSSEVEQLSSIVSQLPSAITPCQSRHDLPVDIIYTDIMGLSQFKKLVKKGYAKFSCLLRIVDSFGTEPAFNHRPYAKSHKILTSWGGHDLNTQQFYTMFPHSPDNSFMGFVVEEYLNDSFVDGILRKNQALVYGKSDYMWKDMTAYLDVIHEFLEIHGTVYSDDKINESHVPPYVVNHGILNGKDLHKLLRQSKLFIGLGFPYEGPAPLEAIANGAVFINPLFRQPHSMKNTKFFKGKPTERGLKSQHPYAAEFIGEPYVYTTDVKDSTELRKVLKEILDTNKFSSYMPFEYTEEGMLQRINYYIENQNFCLPPKVKKNRLLENAIKLILAEPDMSCKDSCWKKGFICEPSYFSSINTQSVFKNFGLSCSSDKSLADIHFPAFHISHSECILQDNEMLFSCVGHLPSLRRICPCRTYMQGQTALCKGCDN